MRRVIHWRRIVATLASLVLIVLLHRHQPSFDDKTAPFKVAGATGRPVHARNFTVQVNKVKLAHGYLIDARHPGDADRELRADGIWLSALADVELLDANGFVSAQLRARDGRTYRAAPQERPDLKGFNLTDTYLVAGLPAHGGYFFDVPIDAVEGASLQFYAGNVAPEQLDDLVDVPLRIDAAKLKALRAEASPMLDLRSPEPPK